MSDESGERGAGAGEQPAGGEVFALGVLAVATGAWTGLLVALFRLGLAFADRLRDRLILDARRWPGGLVLVVAVITAAAVTARWLARRFSPYAAGSGIPEVKLALNRELPQAPLPRLLLVKFVGGLLALGGGMALGPEGPSVQMGAVGARLIGTRFRRAWPDLHSLIAAGTGAGLAVAFNAPIAGVVFVLEALHRRFESRQALAALGASSAAILVARLILGDAPLFHVAAVATGGTAVGLPFAAAATWPLYLVLGALAGFAGATYSRCLTIALRFAERFDGWRIRPQAAAVGLAVGLIGWFAPELIGGGEKLTQAALVGATAVGAVSLIFVLRFCLGVACYGVRAPGGLFAPLLALGAQIGVICGTLAGWAFPGLGLHAQAFAVVGMAAFFTGVVRAPITGMVLVIEMTAAFTTLVPMLAACFAALVVAKLLRVPPIYDTLQEDLLDRARRRADAAQVAGDR